MKKNLILVALFSLLSITIHAHDSHQFRLRVGIQENSIRLIEDAISHGADIERLDEQTRNTALMTAAEYGQEEIVTFLISQGADVNALNESGESALMFAVENNHINICDILIYAGANVNHHDTQKTTSLMLAAQEGNIEILNILLSHGAYLSINEGDYTNKTPLMHATQKDNPTVIALLLLYGADVNAFDDYGRNAYEWASINDNPLIAELLFEYMDELDELSYLYIGS